MGKSRSPTNFCRLEDFQVIVKRNKTSLVSIIYIQKIIKTALNMEKLYG